MTSSRGRRSLGVGACVLALGMAACDPVHPSVEPVSTSVVPTATGQTNLEPDPQTASVPAEPIPGDYSGPSAMPAADGGPMLWLVSAPRDVYEAGWVSEQERYGFVDTTGTLVVPPSYDSYEYCRDSTGRATLVLAGSASGVTDVLDLTGKAVGRIPGRFAQCVGDTHAVFQTDVSEVGPAEFGSGLIELRTGKVILPIRKGRYAVVIDSRTVNVHEERGEYFLDLVTGRTTPHPGFVTPGAEFMGRNLVPASSREPDQTSDETDTSLMGYLSGDGTWALKPVFDNAEPFRASYAVVREGDDEHVIDSRFERVSGNWSNISYLGGGYVAAQSSEQGDTVSILGSDVSVLFESATNATTCSGGQEGFCQVFPRVGPSTLVLLPEGEVTNLPVGFSRALTRTLFDDGGLEAAEPATRVHDSATGSTFLLDRPGLCTASGNWLTCSSVEALPPPIVYTLTGQRTDFREVATVPDAMTDGDAPYSWAIAGTYRGFVDAAGRWLYRQSRYTDLED